MSQIVPSGTKKEFYNPGLYLYYGGLHLRTKRNTSRSKVAQIGWQSVIPLNCDAEADF